MFFAWTVVSRKDLYGNRDPPAAAAAMGHTEAAVEELCRLPQPFRDFYARRALRSLQAAIAGPADPAANGPEGANGRRPPGGPRTMLSSGTLMPLLGIGTWEVARADTGRIIDAALSAGLRHIDCAPAYGNQAEVGKALGRALSAGDVSRRELFVTSKLWTSDFGRVRQACMRSLRELQLDRLDLYLIHWPPSDDHLLLQTWRQMEGLVAEGLVTSIGVSNCSIRKLGLILDDPKLGVAPAVNQVERHPGWRNQVLVDYCASRRIHVTAYSPLGHTGPESGAASLLGAAEVQAAAEALGCTPAQALLRWAMSKGTSAVFRSASPEHVASNAAAMGDPGGTGGSDSDGCDINAQEERAWALLQSLPQARRITGNGFVGSRSGTHQFASLEELWDSNDSGS